jgi:hypothetical protein
VEEVFNAYALGNPCAWFKIFCQWPSCR